MNNRRWLIDYALATVIVYCVSELWLYFTHGAYNTEINLSVVWMLVLAGVALKTLTSLCSLFFLDSQNTGALQFLQCPFRSCSLEYFRFIFALTFNHFCKHESTQLNTIPRGHNTEVGDESTLMNCSPVHEIENATIR